jgi:enoyl-CoA hydratase
MTDAGTAFRSLRYEVADRKAYIALDRPERLNGIDRWMPGETDASVERANDDGEVHVIVPGAKGDRSARLRPRGF